MGEQMDEYSKTAPKTYSARTKAVDKAHKRTVNELMSLTSEEKFIEVLATDFEITRSHASFEPAIKAWRQRH
jgi:hypothetical protein